ncbi:hypothetical protein BDV95DRAFT_448536, partial [Massariosphaeria phaeospora]
SLSSIQLLESLAGYLRWEREISDYFRIAGYGSLLGRLKEEPTDEVRKEAWLERQDRAVAIVQSRCSLNAREEIKTFSRLNEVLAKLKQLDLNFSTFTRAFCKTVLDFAKRLRHARNEIHELDITCRISELYLVNCFFTSLGLEFATFLFAFY